MGKSTEHLIYLVRHAKTQANLDMLYSGSTDVPLCQEGVDEIKELLTKVQYPKVDRHYTSGMTRANQTFELIFPNIPYTKLPELEECNFGDFEMRTYRDLKDLPEYISWVSDPTGEVVCPNGESFNQLLERIMRGINIILEDLNNNDQQSAFVVTHGGVITKLMISIFPEFNMSTDLKLVTKNGEGFCIKFQDGKAVEYTPVP